MLIRDETPADSPIITTLIADAFMGAAHSDGTEGATVRALRDCGQLSLSLVAVADGEIIGHIAFSRVRIARQDLGWFGLGPLAVRSDLQRQGIGGALVRAGLDRLRALGAQGCVVLGDPAYYTRFGFAPDPALVFEGVPPEYFMRLAFTGALPAGEVRYADAFYGG